MLYTSKQLNSLSPKDDITAISRYLFKFINRRSEFIKLKPHEKDYAFTHMKLLHLDSGSMAFNMHKIIEAREYMFYNIVLTYGEDVAGFNGPLYGPYGKISANQIRKDKRLFNEYLLSWINQLKSFKGIYIMVLKPLLEKKLKELEQNCKTKEEFKDRKTYCYAVFFCIYYKAKLYFEERKEKYLAFDVLNYTFVANVYTFCHIYARHYVPSLNRELSNSMNSNIQCIDINNLMESLMNLIISYFNVNPFLDNTKEFLLFKEKGEKYILWIKYKKIDELMKKEGFEIRSFYKCVMSNDLNRFTNTRDIKINNGLYCCITQ